MAIVWIVVTVLLLAVELHHLAFYALFAAAGTLAAAIVAVIAPSAIAVQIVVGTIVAVVGLFAVRPYVSSAVARRRSDQNIQGVHGGLVGARGVTLDEVGHMHIGHIRLLGENWLAVTADDESIPPATHVIVTKVVGTTLTVRSIDGIWELT